jgi:GntR family transcriptional regulator
MDLNDRSIYAILTEAGIVPEEAAEAIELSLLTPREAKALRAIAGIPVALYRRTTYDKEGRPIEFTKVIYRGDRHKFTSRLRRSDLSPERPRD